MRKRGGTPGQRTDRIFTRDFAAGVLTYFSFFMAFSALVPTLPLYFARLGSSTRQIGVLVGIYSVSSLVARFFAGGAVLRFSEKKVMAWASMLFAVSFLACILLHPFWPFLVLRLCQGFAYACLDTAAFALVVRVTSPACRGQALGYFLLAPGLATVLAPSFGVFIVNQFGFTVLFLVCACLSLCALLFSGIVKGEQTMEPDSSAPTSSTAFFEPEIIVPAVSSFFYNFVLGSVMAFVALYAVKRGIKNPGYFFSAAAIMTITGRSLGKRIQDIWSKDRIILVFTFVAMVAMVLLSFSKSLPFFVLVGALWGTGVAFIFPVSMAYSLEYAGSSGGTAVGTFRAVMDLGTATGPMVMGLFISYTGYTGMFLCLALICLVNICYFQFYVRKKKSTRLRVSTSAHA